MPNRSRGISTTFSEILPGKETKKGYSSSTRLLQPPGLRHDITHYEPFLAHAFCLALHCCGDSDNRAEGYCLPADRLSRPALRRLGIFRQPGWRVDGVSHVDNSRAPG